MDWASRWTPPARRLRGGKLAGIAVALDIATALLMLAFH